MTTTTVLTFTLLLAGAIFLVGYFFRESEKRQQAGFLMLTSFLLVMLCGVTLAMSPLQYKNGETSTESYSYTNSTLTNATKNTQYQYNTQSPLLSGTFSLIFILIGIFGTMETTKRLYSQKTDKNSNFRMEE